MNNTIRPFKLNSKLKLDETRLHKCKRAHSDGSLYDLKVYMKIDSGVLKRIVAMHYYCDSCDLCLCQKCWKDLKKPKQLCDNCLKVIRIRVKLDKLQ